MGDATTIEWTDATWNPVRGCAIVSKGCTNCYAMRQAHRSSGPGGAYEGLTQLSNGGPVWTGAVRTVPQLLDQPLRWRRPRRIFVNSMSDLFHEDIDVVFIASVLGIAAACPQHTFQVLTKRAERMRTVVQKAEFLDAYESSQAMHSHNEVPWPPSNVWLGVSVEDQAAADARIPLLLQTPAAVRWISAEPLLGPVRLTSVEHGGRFFVNTLVEQNTPHLVEQPRIDWVVAGGESGPGARPMHPDWPRLLRDDCAHFGVPFFFKQWGSMLPGELEDQPGQEGEPWRRYQDGRRMWILTECYKPRSELASVEYMRTDKKAAGRELDGRTHDEYPA